MSGDESGRDSEGTTDGEAAAEEPLADLAAEVSRRREAGEDDDEIFAEFEDRGVEVDSEAVWAALEADAADVGALAGPPVERVVDKQSYCHRCPFFSEPPEMACTNEGTEILELVDSDHVRVRDCPVAAEREELEATE